MKRLWWNAAVQGNAGKLKTLLEREEEEDVNSRDRYGQTALMIVSRNGHIDAARVLINAHADLDCTRKVRTFRADACYHQWARGNRPALDRSRRRHRHYRNGSPRFCRQKCARPCECQRSRGNCRPLESQSRVMLLIDCEIIKKQRSRFI